MAALLTSVLDSQAKVAEYIGECRESGIDLLPPDINASGADFTVEGDNLRFGLVAVKGVGRGVILDLLSERERGGPFTSFADFCQRLGGADLNRRVAESLIKCGAFDSLGYRRSQLLAVYGQVLDGVAQQRKKNLEGQFDLFGGGGEEPSSVTDPPMPNLPEFTRQERMAMEKETTGLYLTGHPMDEYRQAAKAVHAAPVGAILADFAKESGPDTYRDEQKVTLAGVVAAAKTKTTRNNTLMCYVTLEDDTGSMELLVFARTLSASGALLQENTPVWVTGRLSVRDEKAPQLLVDEVHPLGMEAGNGEEAVTTTKANILYIRLEEENGPIWERVQKIFLMFPGTEKVIFYFAENGRKRRGLCLQHPALIRELEELLGPENVVLRPPKSAG